MVIDPDATALEDAPKAIRNETGGTLPAGTLVYVTGWSEADSSFLVAKADADVPGAEIQAAAVTAAKLSTSAARDNLSSMSDVDRRYVRTTPVTGEFKVIDVRRDGTGKLEVEYDDVPEP